MKLTFYIVTCLSAIFLFTSCDESNIDNETDPTTVYTTPETDSIPDSTPNTGLANLIKTDTGIFRGVTFGMPAEKVKSLEAASSPEEETTEYLDYIVDYNFPETAEVIYYLDAQNQVERIETVIFAENKDSQKKAFDQLVAYYTNRYGESRKSEGDTIRWQSNLDNVMVLLNKKDAQKVHDIILIFKPVEKAAKKNL